MSQRKFRFRERFSWVLPLFLKSLFHPVLFNNPNLTGLSKVSLRETPEAAHS